MSSEERSTMELSPFVDLLPRKMSNIVASDTVINGNLPVSIFNPSEFTISDKMIDDMEYIIINMIKKIYKPITSSVFRDYMLGNISDEYTFFTSDDDTTINDITSSIISILDSYGVIPYQFTHNNLIRIISDKESETTRIQLNIKPIATTCTIDSNHSLESVIFMYLLEVSMDGYKDKLADRLTENESMEWCIFKRVISLIDQKKAMDDPDMKMDARVLRIIKGEN